MKTNNKVDYTYMQLHNNNNNNNTQSRQKNNQKTKQIPRTVERSTWYVEAGHSKSGPDSNLSHGNNSKVTVTKSEET
jgi:hypothetical protein